MLISRPYGIRVTIEGDSDFCQSVQRLLRLILIKESSAESANGAYGPVEFASNGGHTKRVSVDLPDREQRGKQIEITHLFSNCSAQELRLLGDSGPSGLDKDVARCGRQLVSDLAACLDSEFALLPYHFYYPSEQFQQKIFAHFERLKDMLLLCKDRTSPLKNPDEELYFRNVYEGLHLGASEDIRISRRISNKRGETVSSLIVPLSITTWQAYTFLFQEKSRQFNRIQFYLHGILLGFMDRDDSELPLFNSEELTVAAAKSARGLFTRPGYFVPCAGIDVHCIPVRPERLEVDLHISDENIYRFDTKTNTSICYPTATFLRKEGVLSEESLVGKFLKKYSIWEDEECSSDAGHPFLPMHTDGSFHGPGVHFAEVVCSLVKEIASFGQKDLSVLDIFSGPLWQHIPYFKLHQKPNNKVSIRLIDNTEAQPAALAFFGNSYDFEDQTHQSNVADGRFNLYKDINERGGWQVFGDTLAEGALKPRKYDLIIANPVHNEAAKFLLANVGYKDQHGRDWATGERMVNAIRRHSDVFAMFLMNTEQRDYLDFVLKKLRGAYPVAFTIALYNEIVVVCCSKLKEGIVRRSLESCALTYSRHYYVEPAMVSVTKVQETKSQGQRIGKILVFTGPSAAGKDTLIDLLLERYQYKRLFSKPTMVTTRPPRPGEGYLCSMEFTDEQTFNGLYEQGDITRVNYAGHLYGTFIRQIREIIDVGVNVVLNMNVEGIRTLLEIAHTGLFVEEEILCLHVTANDAVRIERLRARTDGHLDEDGLKARIDDGRNYRDLSGAIGLSHESIVLIDNNDARRDVALNCLETALKSKGVLPPNAQAVSSRLVDSEYESSSAFAFYANYTNEKVVLAQAIRTLLPLKETLGSNDARYMDIGAGAGQITAELAQRYCEVVAIEPALAMRRFLKENLDRVRFSMPINTFKYTICRKSWEELLADREALDELGYFDLITMNHVYSFLRDRIRTVYVSIIEKLKPGGTFVATYVGDGCGYEKAYEGVKLYFKHLSQWQDIPASQIIRFVEARISADGQGKHYPSCSEIRNSMKNICEADPRLEFTSRRIDTTVSLRIKPEYSAIIKFMFGVFYEELTKRDVCFLGEYLESLGCGSIEHNFFNVTLANELLVVSKASIEA